MTKIKMVRSMTNARKSNQRGIEAISAPKSSTHSGIRIIAWILASLFFGLVADVSSAQSQIQVTVTIDSPVPPFIERWDDLVAVELQVNPSASQETYSVSLTGRATHLEAGSDIQVVSTRTSEPILVSKSDGIVQLTITDIRRIFGPGNVDFQGFDPINFRSGDGSGQRVPGGCYEICVQAFDANTLTPLGESCSIPFGVLTQSPPRLLQPMADASVEPQADIALIPSFQWQIDPVVASRCAIGPSPLLEYEFELVEVPFGVTGSDMLESGGGTVLRESIPDGSTVFDFVPDDHGFFPMVQGARYAWRVRAQDIGREVFIENDGYSSVRVFQYGMTPTELIVAASPLLLTFTPSEPSDDLTLQMTAYSPDATGPVMRVESARYMILDGDRIVHGPVDVPFGEGPVLLGHRIPIYEVDLNIAMPSTLINTLLGTRSDAELTMMMSVIGHSLATGDEIIGREEIAINLTGSYSPLIVRALTLDGEPMTWANTTITPDQANFEYSWEFENTSSRPITVQTFETTITTEDGTSYHIESRPFPDGFILPPRETIRLENQRFLWSALLDWLHRMIDPESGISSFRVDGVTAYTAVNDAGDSITAQGDYSLLYDDVPAFPLVINVLNAAGDPMTADNTTISPDHINIEFRYEIINRLPQSITLSETSFVLQESSRGEILRQDRTFPTPITVEAGASFTTEPRILRAGTVLPILDALVDLDDGNFVFPVVGVDEFRGVDELANEINVYSRYSFTYDHLPAEPLRLRVLTAAGDPMSADNTFIYGDDSSVSYRIEYVNDGDRPITINSSTTIVEVGGTELRRTNDTHAVDVVIPAGESRAVDPATLNFADIIAAIEATINTGDGDSRATLDLSTIVLGTDDLGNEIMAPVPYEATFIQGSAGSRLHVTVSAADGLPVRLTPVVASQMLTYHFRNTAATPIRITGFSQEFFGRDGESIVTTSTPPPTDWTTIEPGATVSRELEFGWPPDRLPTVSSDVSEGARATVTWVGTEESGRENEATVRIPIQFLPSFLTVSVSSEDGLPLDLFPGQRFVDVTYRFANLGIEDVEVFNIEQWVVDGSGTQVSPPETFARPTPLRVDAGETTEDASGAFGLTESGVERLAATDPTAELYGRVRFTARLIDQPSETVTAFVEFPIRIRQNALLITAIPEDGFPVTIYPGVDRRSLTYRYTNQGPVDLDIVAVEQDVFDESGGILAEGSRTDFSRPIVVAAGASVTDDQFFGIQRSVIDRILSERGDNVALTVRVTFTVRNGSTESLAQIEYSGLLTNSTLLVSVESDKPFPITFFRGDSVHAATFRFRNVGSTDVSVESVRQFVRDAEDEFTQGPFDFPLRDPLLIPAGETVANPSFIGTAQAFMDNIRARGADRLLTSEYTFTASRGSESITATTHVPIRVAVGDRVEAGLQFAASEPSDGASVRASTRFAISSTESVTLSRVSGIYLQVWRVPDGSDDPTEIMVPANRVAERVFANSSSEQLIRHNEEANTFLFLETRGATAESDTPYSFTGESDASYMWVARVDFVRNAAGEPEASDMSTQPARFTYRTTIAECGAECTLTAPSGSGDRTRSAEYYVRRVVRIGAFDMRILTARGTGANLTGEGAVDVPYLRAPILVEFSGIAINSANEVVSGEAKAKTDRPDLLTNEYTERITDMSESMSITTSEAENIAEISEAIESTGRIVSTFSSSDDPVQLPLGIDQHIDGEFLLLAIVGIKFKPTGARLNAVLSVPLPEIETRLAIGARGICLTPTGFSEEITFYLANDLFVTLNEFDATLPDYTMRFKEGSTDGSGTYLTWRCGEMQALRLEMWHEFPREWIKPVDPTTGEIVADETKKSTAKLVVEVRPASASGAGDDSGGGSSGGGSSGGGGSSSGSTASDAPTSATGMQWIAGVSEFTPSAISDANGFWFAVESMFYDNSSVQNPAGMTFPAGYSSELSNVRWTGFYLETVRLNLPDEIRSFGEDQNIELQVRNVLLDRTGLNFTFAVRNLLTLKDGDGSDATDCAAVTGDGATASSCTGNLGGWEFSVDELSISVLHSSFGTANLNGQIRIPITETPLAYSATLARPASLRMDDSSGDDGGSEGSDGSGGGASTSTDEGSRAASQFGFECADLLAPRSSGGGSGGSTSGAGSSTSPDLIFEMLVKPTGEIKGDIWAADLTIAASSKICVGNQSGSIQAGAELNGRIGLGEEDSMIPASITGIPLEKLRVMTFAPYFEAPFMARSPFTGRDGSDDSGGGSGGESGAGGSSSSSGGSGFAVDISDIGIEVKAASPSATGRLGIEAGLSFDVAIQLPGDGVFRASARGVTVWGRVNMGTADEPADFEFAGFGGIDGPGTTIPLFCVGGEAEILKIEGCIQAYKDRESRHTPGAYDSGVAGAIDAVIAQQIGLRVAADFGERTQGDASFGYFFVDAAAYITSGVNIGGAVALYGIMGGVWYNMTGPGGWDSSTSTDDYSAVRSQAGAEAEPSLAAALEKYRPVSSEREGTWGFKAGIIIGAAGGETAADAFNMDVFVEVQFREGGNFEYLSFVGDAYVMTKLTDRSDPKIRGTLEILIAVRENGVTADGTPNRETIFDANFSLEGDLEVLHVSGRAGLHIEPAYWQFFIGRPPRDERFRARLGSGDGSINILDFGAYVMAGERLPPFHPPPVEGFVDEIDPAEQARLLALASGEEGVSGFMMGADFRIEPELDLILFGLSGYLELGFDVGVTKSGLMCIETVDGRPTGNNFQRGEDGWYVEGQIYALAGLSFWTRALFGIKVTIMRLDAGLRLQGGFPNPEYFSGSAFISGELLGAIEFHEQVDFTIGDRCEIAPRNPLEELELITDLRPDRAAPHRDPEVSPFVVPAAAYLLNLNEPFYLQDEAGLLRRFRVVSDGLTIWNIDDDENVNCSRTIGSGGAVESCKPLLGNTRAYSSLVPKTNFRVRASVKAEEALRSWEPARTREGELITQERTAEFRTGCLPSTLDGFVAMTYPMNGQRYFLPEETAHGFVSVNQDFNYLAADEPLCGRASPNVERGSGYDFLVRLSPLPDGMPIDIPATYESQTFRFVMPTLDAEQVYAAQLIRKRRSSTTTVTTTTTTATSRRLTDPSFLNPLSEGMDGGSLRLADVYQLTSDRSMTVRRRTIGALETTNLDEDRLYHWVFRTSQFGTLQEKMDAASFGNATYTRGFALVFEVNQLSWNVTPSEPFDDIDLHGRDYVVDGGTFRARRAIKMASSVEMPPYGMRDTPDTYISRYAYPDIYVPEMELERWHREIRYDARAPRTAFDQLSLSEQIVSMVSSRRLPPLPDDPDALADYLIRNETASTSSTSSSSSGDPTAMYSTRGLQSGFSPLRMSVSASSMLPTYSLKYNVGSAVSADLATLRHVGARMISMHLARCAAPLSQNRCTRWEYPDKDLVRVKMALPFRPYSRGTYPIAFRYMPVSGGDLDMYRDTRPYFTKSLRY